MNTERVPHSGAVVVTALVSDGAGPWYLSRTYYGYTVAEARRAYRAYCKECSLTMEGGR
jgi:hypothetical protein